MKDIIKLRVTRRDCKKAGRYYDNGNCLLATAVKRHAPAVKDVSVIPGSVYIDGVRFGYHHRRDDLRAVTDAYFTRTGKDHRADERPSLAHFKPFTLTLRRAV
jgi:hypothetical protein